VDTQNSASALQKDVVPHLPKRKNKTKLFFTKEKQNKTEE
jgi:hypothetical protein